MNRIRTCAAMAAVVLAATISPSSADDGTESTSAGYSSDTSGYIAAIYRFAVTSVDPAEIIHGATKAECKFDVTGVGNSSGGTATGVFVAKVVTTATKPNATPIDRLPAATGVACELRHGDTDTLLLSWEALRSGNVGHLVTTGDVTGVRRPKICVRAWVLFGDNTRRDLAKHCEPPSLLL